ncbi:calcium:sodium antiporter [Aureococcus anophagefferens]|nr:calcium:sodium antiporter [Aureococcus anophagefferens]
MAPRRDNRLARGLLAIAAPVLVAAARDSICHKGQSGLFLPLFGNKEQRTWDEGSNLRYGRAVLYLLGLLWFFLGVSIIADVFMAAIETITSKEKKVWNATVANLTLMALGSSAPEILLSVIEILTNSFFTGDLGPSTIVGSAAFNMFCIIAICMVSLPGTETRKIEDMSVYTVTAFFSVFAYVWLLFILMVTSPDVVEIWEAIFTFLFFPILVALAYAADRGYFDTAKISPVSSAHVIQVGSTPFRPYEFSDLLKKLQDPTLEESERHDLVKKLAMGQKAKPSRGARMNAVRAATGQKVIKADGPDPKVLANPAEGPMTIKWATRDGTAKGSEVGGTGDYETCSGELTFADKENFKTIVIKVFDDNETEDDEVFYVDLLEVAHGGKAYAPGPSATQRRGEVTIIDDDEPGELSFEPPKEGAEGGPVLTMAETCGKARVKREGTFVFENTEVEKFIEIPVINTNRYEGESEFTIVLKNFAPPSAKFGKHTELKVVIVADTETKDMIDNVQKYLESNDASYNVGSTWGQQFSDALKVGGGDADDDFKASAGDWVMHIITLPWKVAFAFVPPTRDDQRRLADAAVGNVTGSNSVNVFLGLGLPWSIAAIYWSGGFAGGSAEKQWRIKYGGKVDGVKKRGTKGPDGSRNIGFTEDVAFIVPAGNLGLSVGVFVFCACTCLGVLAYRRKAYGAELGGDRTMANRHATLFVMLWFLYVAMSILASEGIV